MILQYNFVTVNMFSKKSFDFFEIFLLQSK